MWVCSTRLLTAPVRSHWAAKCFCDRRATRKVTPIDIGTITSEISASSQLIDSIMTSTPRMVRMEVSSWLRPCCRVVVTLSMSLVTRLSTSPWGWLSKYWRGRRASLASTSRRIPETVRCATPAMM